MASREELTETIINVIQETLALKGSSPVSLSVESNINQSLGLESLDWAAIVAVLEERTQVDPFQQGLKGELRTLGDFVDLYVSETSRSTVAGESGR